MTVQWTWGADPGPGAVDPSMLRRLHALVDGRIEEQKGRYIERLQALLRLPTVSGAADARGQRTYREAMDACLQLVREQASAAGYDYREHDGQAAMAQWAGRGEGSIGVAMHLDVVPPGGTWRHEPFGGEVVDEAVWGRGAQDDKGPVAMAFAALDVLQRLGLRPNKDIRLFFGTLEETDDWPDMDLLLEREDAPDVALVPDGAFPIIVGEKGICTVEWHGRWDETVERDGLRFVGLRSGERHNIVPGEALAWFTCAEQDLQQGTRTLASLPGRPQVKEAQQPPPEAHGAPCLEVTWRGKAAHGAFPKDGHNAALDALQDLQAWAGGHGVGQWAEHLLGHCQALDASGIGLTGYHTRMGSSTLNLGVVHAGATRGHAHINVRFPVGVTAHEVVDRFWALAEKAPEGLTLSLDTRGRAQDPVFVDPDDHPGLIHALQAAYGEATGRAPRLATIAGTTYAKIFPLAVAFGPQDESAGEPILAHQEDERVLVERHLENIRVYAMALALLAFDRDELREVCGLGGA